MILSFVACIALLQGQDTVVQPTAGQLISKMLARYSNVDSEVGRIRLTVAAANDKVTVDTEFAFQKPNLVYIHQTLNTREPKEWLTVSNGTVFSYNMPNSLATGSAFSPSANNRLREAVTVKGVSMSCREIYGASTESLKDRSMPLDIAFARSTDLKFRIAQWDTHNALGRETIGEQSAYVIGGNWREYPTAPVSGKYKMWITEAGDLLRYEELQTIGLPNQDPRAPLITQLVTSTWEVDIKINVPPDKALFANVP